MDEAMLVQIVDKVFDLVCQRGIEVQEISVQISVSGDYFRRIKENFPDRRFGSMPDIALGASHKDRGPITVGLQIVRIPERMPIEPSEAHDAKELIRQLARDAFDLLENEYQMDIESFHLTMWVPQDVLEEQRAKFQDVVPESDEVKVINQKYIVGIIDRRQRWEIVFKPLSTD